MRLVGLLLAGDEERLVGTEDDGIRPLHEDGRYGLGELQFVVVVCSRGLAVLQRLDLARGLVREDNHVHPGLREFRERVEDGCHARLVDSDRAPVVVHGEDVLDLLFAGEFRGEGLLELVGGVDHEAFVALVVALQFRDKALHAVVGLRKVCRGELVHRKAVRAVLEVEEERVRQLRGERRLSDAVHAVDHDAQAFGFRFPLDDVHG